MRFAVLALASVPDVVTARRLFELHDLDDKSVAKVLFHRRKQQTGSSEELRWDQRAIAGLTLIQHSVDDVTIESLHLGTQSEAEMLHAFYRVMLRYGSLVSWEGGRQGLPLIHFRTLMQDVSYPAYWQALRERSDLHLDISDWLAPTPDDRPSLDETARRLGLPGLLGHDEVGLVDAWLQGRHEDIQAFSDIVALNTYLLALRLFGTTGEVAPHDNARVMTRLRELLAGARSRHLTDFLATWGED